jgi:hypothetical protein
MTNPSWTWVAKAGLVAELALTAAATAHAAPGGRMHGNPAAAAPFWRYQQQDLDCGEMAVADVIGQITGNEPSEDEITSVAANIPGASRPGPIYSPSSRTKSADLPVLLAHYGIKSSGVHTDLDALERDLDQGRKVIVGVNNQIIWNEGGNRGKQNHFVVVTGIDTGAGVVHLNDSGIKAGRDEQVSVAIFEQAAPPATTSPS